MITDSTLEPSAGKSRLEWFFIRTGKALCGMTGHNYITRLQPGRMFPECMNCGYQTPGWTISKKEELSS